MAYFPDNSKITIHDTTVVYQTDTLWLTDTVYIHDTVYITEESIGDVEAMNAKVYSSQRQVVVGGAHGDTHRCRGTPAGHEARRVHARAVRRAGIGNLSGQDWRLCGPACGGDPIRDRHLQMTKGPLPSGSGPLLCIYIVVKASKRLNLNNPARKCGVSGSPCPACVSERRDFFHQVVSLRDAQMVNGEMVNGEGCR